MQQVITHLNYNVHIVGTEISSMAIIQGNTSTI